MVDNATLNLQTMPGGKGVGVRDAYISSSASKRDLPRSGIDIR